MAFCCGWQVPRLYRSRHSPRSEVRGRDATSTALASIVVVVPGMTMEITKYLGASATSTQTPAIGNWVTLTPALA
jgi:hypothetical protein